MDSKPSLSRQRGADDAPGGGPAERDFQDLGAEARETLGWILGGMGIPAQIEHLVREDHILLNVLCGENSSIAIGRKGQTLEALQLLVNRIVSRIRPESVAAAKIVVDVEGYRHRRKVNLLDTARRTAEVVRESGEPSLIGPFNAYERFLIHNALKKERGVVSQSQGEGIMKEILVVPASSPEG